MSTTNIKNIANQISARHRDYIYALFSLLLIFCLLSGVELYKNFAFGTYYHKICNDFTTVLFIGILFLPLHLLLHLQSLALARRIIQPLFILIALIQLALVGYNQTTHINLGADLLGYSLKDIYITVTSSLSLSPLMVLPFAIVPLLFLGLIRLLQLIGKKQNLSSALLYLLLIAACQGLIAKHSKAEYQNKLQFLISDILRSKNEDSLLSQAAFSATIEYPLEKSSQTTSDVLSPFFNLQDKKPNIVFIIIEGLGRDFTDDGQYSGFTPYLDSLRTKSLYWKNFLSNAGRTFGALPALTASLPFGKDGFMELEAYPRHQSLISILKSNNYKCSYYCGDDITFDKKSTFLQYNGIDYILDVNKFGPGYIKTRANKGGFSWGYPDQEIYRKTLTELDHSSQPRLDIIMSLSNHEPFEFPSKEIYLKKVESILDTKSYLEKTKLKEYAPIFASLLYTDQALKNFMSQYAKRPDYLNTIFIITGDHRLVPIPQKDNLSRFHVPFYIFCPMLKKTAIFRSVSSHNDVTPSLVSFLSASKKINNIEKTYWMGQGLDTVRAFRNIHSTALMRYKGSIIDYIYKDYFYSDGQLFKIDSNFNISESDDPIASTVESAFKETKQLHNYLTVKNKISPITGTHTAEHKRFSPQELRFIKQQTKGLNSDQTYALARELAINKQREKSRLLCDYILNGKPNYVDFRILKGRTFAWEGDYKNAEIQLQQAINTMPFYDDGYNALLDMYFWSDQNSKAVKLGKQALSNRINNPEIGFKLARAYQKTNNKTLAKIQIDSLLRIYPTNTNYQKFRKSLQ